LWLRLDRDIPYPVEQVRSVTLLYEGGRLWLEVTAEVPVAAYPDREGPDPGRIAGVDLGIIHPYAVAGPQGQALLVSGRAIRAEHRLHLSDTKQRRRGDRPAGPEAWAAGITAVAENPNPGPVGGGPAPPPGPASPTRSRPHRR
jgi:putative transposase